jgi:hypothetical protein
LVNNVVVTILPLVVLQSKVRARQDAEGQNFVPKAPRHL